MQGPAHDDRTSVFNELEETADQKIAETALRRGPDRAAFAIQAIERDQFARR
jgi:hypothetical protein